MIAYHNNSDTLFIVLHEIYGVNDHMHAVCRSLAEQGYDVICPDLINREPYDYNQEQEAYQNFIQGDRFTASSQLVVEILQKHRHKYQKQFIMGYSVGATIAWLCSEHGDLCDGIIGMYGSRIRNHLDIDPKCPVLLIFAEQEQSFRVNDIVNAINNKKMVQLLILEGRHGFANPFSIHYLESSWQASKQAITDFVETIILQSRNPVSNYKSQFLDLIRNNTEIMNDLKLVRDLELPECYISAGYIRNYIWDYIHRYSKRTPLNDIDVIYYDPNQMNEEVDIQYEQLLIERTGNPIWSVKNQARMHIRNGEAPYKGIEDAISRWPENVTGIAVRLDDDDQITYVCPYGLDAIFEGKVSQSPLFPDRAYYESRVSKKNWTQIWPKLQIK